jgi:hypothetical protein
VKRFIVLFLSCWCLPAFAADALDSLPHVQRERAGSRANVIFGVLDSSSFYAISPEEQSDLRFLLAYLPLSDLATMTGEILLENVGLARQAREEFPWGTQVPDQMFRDFVLPHRVTQEPYVHGWRQMFHDELAPRLRSLSMSEAALEVNHWCHEKATYQPSDSRDQDPLTTLRAGLGRCEEEMILAICALRSVGIPARQCYTPYWPHMDDNHAWVEVWTDGKWHYVGACEPDVALDHAWFSRAAARAMLVVSTAYGDYQGDEPVLRRVGRTTLINSTAVYGSTHTVHVRLEDHRGGPLPKANVVFSLFNYGAILPAVALETDTAGEAHLTCGLGDWFVSAGKDEWATFKHLAAADTHVVLRLGQKQAMREMTDVIYTPPPEAPPREEISQDSLFACRLANEDRMRENFWGTWADERGIGLDSIHRRPDSLLIAEQAATCSLDGAKLYELFVKARGNWGNLHTFLFECYPGEVAITNARGEQDQLLTRRALLDQLTEKDARDFSVDVLNDHLCFTSLNRPLSNPETWPYLSRMDSASRKRYEEYVVSPRIDREPSRAWRQALCLFLKEHLRLMKSRGDKAVMKWLRKNIIVDKDRDRLGPPLTPAECLELRRGTADDIERLYVGLCRVREIPARFDPVANRLQRWENGDWLNVDLGVRKKRKEFSTASGFLTVVPADSDSTTMNARYNREWGVQMWDKDHFTDVDFGFETALKDQTWPKELPIGLYCLTSGIRRKDGSVPLRMAWFEVRPGGPSGATLNFVGKGARVEP